MRSTVSDTFWILVLAVVVLFAFFVALGAFSPGEVAWLQPLPDHWLADPASEAIARESLRLARTITARMRDDGDG